MKRHNVVIIGGGPGGYSAALHLAKYDYKVILVEKAHLGGVCLNEGCIPTKAFLYSIEQNIKANSKLDTWKLAKTCQENLVNRGRENIREEIREQGVELVYGTAFFTGENEISIALQDQHEILKLVFDYCIIATGSLPRELCVEGLEDTILYSHELLQIDNFPDDLVIIGGGVIGVEMASIFTAMGCNITILEKQYDILSCMDRDIVRAYKRGVQGQGIKIYTDVTIEEIEKKDKGLNCVIKFGDTYEEVKADMILAAIGRVPNIGKLDLNIAGIDYNNRGICVDNEYRTKNKRIFALGDCIDSAMPKLAHAAEQQAYEVCRIIAGKNYKKSRAIPECCYSHPQMFQVGNTFGELEKLRDFKWIYRENPIAKLQDDQFGIIKMTVNETTHQILKIAMAGWHVSEYSGEAAIIVENGLLVEDVAFSVHPHPTVCEEIEKFARNILDELEG